MYNDKEGKQVSIETVQKKWTQLAKVFSRYDAAPQTFYYTLLNMLQMATAKSVLEIGCGAGRLLPYAVQIKRRQTAYHATDLIPQMVKQSENNLRNNFERYDSKLSFEQWLKKEHIVLQPVNGQQVYGKGLKFDRIVCNLVLMLTPNPQKMLNSMTQVAEQGCLMGITIIGNRQKNDLIRILHEVLKECGDDPTKYFDPTALYNKVEPMVEKEGWEILSRWEQTVPFELTQIDDEDEMQKKFIYNFYQHPDPETRAKMVSLARQKYKEFLQSKKLIQVHVQMLVARKKKSS